MKFLTCCLASILILIPTVKGEAEATHLEKDKDYLSLIRILESSFTPDNYQFLSRALAQNPPLVEVKLFTPDTSVKFAANDILSIPLEVQPYIRYLSLYNLPKPLRKKMGETVSFMVNSLSKRKTMYIPTFVAGSDETVIRLNIEDYEWSAKVWDDLAKNGSGPKATPEPYFHSFLIEIGAEPPKKVKKKVKKEVVKKVPTGKYDNRGQPLYEEKKEIVEVEEDADEPGDQIKKRIFKPAAWVDPVAYDALVKCCVTESPMLRADWFIANVSLPPAYYDFLGLGKTIKDFRNLIFADEEKSEKARSQYKGVVVTSTVARNNRTLLRSPTFTDGYYWESHDSKFSVEDRQYVQNILNEKFDATEDIGTLSNGLQVYFLTNGKGDRLDFADPDIAIDNSAIDRIVRNGRSCIVCHAEGIKPIDDEIRTLTKKMQNREEIKLLITKKEDAYKIMDLFGSNLDFKIVQDQNIYAQAVKASNGLDSALNAKQYNEFYNNYVEILLSLDVVSRETGIPIVDVLRYAKFSKDPVVLGLLRDPIRPLRRDQWERAFQGFMVIIMTDGKAIDVQSVPIKEKYVK